MAASYPGKEIKDEFNVGDIMNVIQPKVDDVITGIGLLSDRSNYIELNCPEETVKKLYQFNGNKTHFQGIARLQNSGKFLVTGGDKKNKTGQIFVFEYQSYEHNRKQTFNKNLWCSSNVILPNGPPIIDTLKEIHKIKVGNFWHPGGIATLGDLVAIPHEDGEGDMAFVEFYNFHDPLNPQIIKGARIVRNNLIGKAGSVALCKLSNGRFMCAAWRDKGKSRKWEFYLSKSDKIEEGFRLLEGQYVTVALSMTGMTVKEANYQWIQFIMQSDGRLFLVGCHASALAPIIDEWSKNLIDVFEVTINDEALYSSEAKLSWVKVQHILRRDDFEKEGKNFSFSAGNNIYISANNLMMYSVAHFIHEEKLNITEFVQSPTTLTKITSIENSIIELYDKVNFRGRCLRIYGTVHSRLMDYNQIKVQDETFNDKIKSARYILPEGITYQLFEHTDFVKPLIKLIGNGSFMEINNFYDQSNKVSSSQYLNI